MSERIKLKKQKFQKEKKQHGWVYVGHLPHGFYEEEMKSYFEQFGEISHIRVCRSKKTGKSKGFGFIEFVNHEVAKVVADTMNNYLMFKKRLIAKLVPPKRMERYRIDKNIAWSEENYPLKKIRQDGREIKNEDSDEAKHLTRCRHYLKQVKKSTKKLHDLGIEYTFTPVDVPEQLVSET